MPVPQPSDPVDAARPHAPNAVVRRRPRRSPRRRRGAVAALAVIAVLAALAACDGQPSWHGAPSRDAGGAASGKHGAASTDSASAPSSAGSGASSTAKGSGSAAEDACVARVLGTLSPSQLAGQVMLVGTPITSPNGIEPIIRKYDIGGIFLNGRSHASAATVKSRIATLQALAPSGNKMFFSLDQEGGEVQALNSASFPAIPTAVAQGKLSHAALAASATSWAGRLAAVGITLDLAPVSDTVPTSIGTKNPPIGALHRQYGSDPTVVAGDITVVVTSAQRAGVMTTLKHFPGLGRVLANTDFSTKAVDTVATADDPNLKPFVAGIHAGTGAVMISSASYPHLDPHTIAIFSEPVITGLLKKKLGFTGMIVSDAMGGAKAVSIVPVGQRAVKFIAAGGDLALTAQYQKAPKMIAGLIAEAAASPTFAARLRDAATHVLRAKYTAGLLGCSPNKS